MKHLFLLIAVLLTASAEISAQKNSKTQVEPIVLISTEFGDVKIKLYNETPIHRDNFLKLASEKKYDGSIFHRIIPSFMVQGGGIAQEGETIDAEINQKYIHKRGALAAARMGDNVNPMKKSSGSQFYIVQGRPFTKEDIISIGSRAGFPYTEEQINAYVKLGGAPHLDGGYTVFGEVIEGMDVIDKIAAVERNPQDKPLKDVTMKMKVLKK